MNWRFPKGLFARWGFEGARLQACRQSQPDTPASAAEGQVTSGPKGRPTRNLVTARLKPRPFKDGQNSYGSALVRCGQLAILLLAIFLFLGAGDDARFNSIGHRMMCTCGCGQVLLECNHVGCQSSDKMRNQLLAALEKGGESDDLILQGFVQEYGPTVIAAPTTTGFNRVAWIMPFAALAAGMAFVVLVVRAWKNKPAPALGDGITIPRGAELDALRERARKETDV
jgi:cytochrome c-type biogenesis protein CcmH